MPPRDKSPPPPKSRPPSPISKTPTDLEISSPIREEPLATDVQRKLSTMAPLAKIPTSFTPAEALARSAVLVDQIPALVEQMRYHRKQARRLNEVASGVFDAIDSLVPKPITEAPNNSLNIEGIERLLRVLYRIEERLRDVGSGNFVTRMTELTFVQQDLSELEDECVEVADIFGVEAPLNYARTEKAKHEDATALKDLAAALEKDPDALADKIGLRNSKLDDESQKSLQIMLYSIEHSPDKVLPEFRTFAESAARTVYTRTRQEIPRDLPWHVRPREFKQGQKIGDGGFSTVYKGYWIARQHEVAIKVFDEQGDNIDKMIKEIVIWKEHKHRCLLEFFAGCLFGTPKFLVSPYCKNGNALDYLKAHPEANRPRILLDVSRGMFFLHTEKIVHGDLKARNVLVGDDGRALVADFGLAEFERDTTSSRAGTATPSSSVREKTPRLIGTPHWLSPECFKDGATDRKFADVWAFGMTAYELYENGRVPLGHLAVKDLSEKLESGERPSKPSAHVPPEHIWKMMVHCWDYDTLQRPSFAEITMALGFFEGMDDETVDEVSATLESLTPDLSKWPGLLKQLVKILKSTLRSESPASETTVEPNLSSIPHLSPSEEKLVILVLTMIKNTTNFSLYADLQMQTIYNSGAIATLHHILKRKEDIKNPEILSIAVSIIAEAMQSLDTTGKATSLSPSDFIDVLMQLVSSSDEKASTHALSTMRALINSFDKGDASDDHLNLRKRVVHNGLVPRLVDVLRGTKNADPIREAVRIVMLLGTDATVLEEAHIQAVCPVIVDVACNLETAPSGRTWSLYGMTFLLTEAESQRDVILSCGLLPPILTLIESKSPQLFEGDHYFVGDTLEKMARPEDIPALLELLQISDDRPPESRSPYPSGKDPIMAAKIAACDALAWIGSDLKTPDERGALANKYPVFTTLQPFLSSSNENLVDSCRKALAWFSVSQDFPFVLQLLSDKSAGALAVATKICVSIVENATDDRKVAATGSGILPELKLILDHPPTRSPPAAVDPAAIPLPLSPSPSPSALVEADDARLIVPPVAQTVGDRSDVADERDSTETARSSASLAEETRASINALTLGLRKSSLLDANPAESLMPSSNRTATHDGEGPVLNVTTLVNPADEAAIAETASPLRVAASSDNDTLSLPRSPKAKAVSFGLTDQVMTIGGDEEDLDPATVDSPRLSSGLAMPDKGKAETSERDSAESLARQETKNKEDTYSQAYVALAHIVDVSKDSLDSVAEAYVSSGLHEPLIKTLDEPVVEASGVHADAQRLSLRILSAISDSTDDVRLALIRTDDFLEKLRRVLHEEKWPTLSKRAACGILHGLLMGDGGDEDILDAIEDEDFVLPLGKFIADNSGSDAKYGAQSLSQLIAIFSEDTPAETVKVATDQLFEFCTRPGKSENIDEVFSERMYILVDYLQSPLAATRRMGLALALLLVKRVDHRRTLANLADLRGAVEGCTKDEDEEIRKLASELLIKVKGGRGGKLGAGGRASRSRASNTAE